MKVSPYGCSDMTLLDVVADGAETLEPRGRAARKGWCRANDRTAPRADATRPVARRDARCFCDESRRDYERRLRRRSATAPKPPSNPATSSSGHVVSTGAGAVAAVHMPTCPVTPQLRIGPLQAVSQQNPSTQNVDWQSVLSVHGAPFDWQGAEQSDPSPR